MTLIPVAAAAMVLGAAEPDAGILADAETADGARPPVVVTCGPASADENDGPGWEFWAAMAAVVVAVYAAAAARRQNRIAATTPWAGVVAEILEQELQNNGNDASTFRGIFGVSRQPTIERKRALRAALSSLRDESAQKLQRLVNLAPAAGFLFDLKARRDSEFDSYLDNAELEISDDRRGDVLRKYQVASARYARALRMFAVDLVHRDLLEKEDLPEILRKKYTQQ